jgi:hypothetical protein
MREKYSLQPYEKNSDDETKPEIYIVIKSQVKHHRKELFLLCYYYQLWIFSLFFPVSIYIFSLQLVIATTLTSSLSKLSHFT